MTRKTKKREIRYIIDVTTNSEELEKILLMYLVYRNELQLKCKKNFKIANEKQLHKYAFNKIIENEDVYGLI